MAENSKIEWTHHTFNAWEGCTKVSPGCLHCYAEARANRLGTAEWGPQGTRRVKAESAWGEPLKWDRQAAKAGRRERVFCLSIGDVFEDWTGQCSRYGEPVWITDGGHWIGGMRQPNPGCRPLTLDDARRRLARVVWETPNLDWLFVTKRPENAREMTFRMWFPDAEWPKNYGIGASVESQEWADKRIPILLQTPAPMRFLSMEPLLGPVDLTPWLVCQECHGKTWDRVDVYDIPCPQCGGNFKSIDWVIVGGESGDGARPMHPDWARSLRDQCVEAGVPFFFKQWGEWLPPGQAVPWLDDVINPREERWIDPAGLGGDRAGAVCVTKVGKKHAGRLLDGREWSEFPTPTRAAS